MAYSGYGSANFGRPAEVEEAFNKIAKPASIPTIPAGKPAVAATSQAPSPQGAYTQIGSGQWLNQNTGQVTSYAPDNQANAAQQQADKELLAKTKTPYTLTKNGEIQYQKYDEIRAPSYMSGYPTKYVARPMEAKGKLWTVDSSSPLSSLFSASRFAEIANLGGDQGYQLNVGDLTAAEKGALGIADVDNGYGVKFTDFSKPGWGIEVKKKAKGGVGLGGLIQTNIQHLKDIGSGIIKDPTRLITGIDPLSTKVWNTALGTDNKALITQMGGATEDTLKKTGASDFTRGAYKAADAVAGVVGGMGAASALSGAVGSGSGILGSSVSTGSNLGNSIVGGALKGAASGAVSGGAQAAINGGDILNGALKGAGTGALTGGVGAGIGAVAPSISSGLSGVVGNTAGNALTKIGVGALTGGVTNAIQGKDFMAGIKNGAIGGGVGAAGGAVGGFVGDAVGNKTVGDLAGKVASGALGMGANALINKGAANPRDYSQQQAIAALAQQIDAQLAARNINATPAQKQALLVKAMQQMSKKG